MRISDWSSDVCSSDLTVADLAGVRGIVDALQRIEAGSERPEDFDAVGERWDIHAQLHQALSAMTLEHLEAATPAARLSGGEAMRVALPGAFVSGHEWLLLDEPSHPRIGSDSCR